MAFNATAFNMSIPDGSYSCVNGQCVPSDSSSYLPYMLPIGFALIKPIFQVVKPLALRVWDKCKGAGKDDAVSRVDSARVSTISPRGEIETAPTATAEAEYDRFLPPPEDVLIGDDLGIQWYNNNCAIASLLTGMFAVRSFERDTFGELLLEPKEGETILAHSVRRELISIVNDLRRDEKVVDGERFNGRYVEGYLIDKLWELVDPDSYRLRRVIDPIDFFTKLMEKLNERVGDGCSVTMKTMALRDKVNCRVADFINRESIASAARDCQVLLINRANPKSFIVPNAQIIVDGHTYKLQSVLASDQKRDNHYTSYVVKEDEKRIYKFDSLSDKAEVDQQAISDVEYLPGLYRLLPDAINHSEIAALHQKDRDKYQYLEEDYNQLLKNGQVFIYMREQEEVQPAVQLAEPSAGQSKTPVKPGSVPAAAALEQPVGRLADSQDSNSEGDPELAITV